MVNVPSDRTNLQASFFVVPFKEANNRVVSELIFPSMERSFVIPKAVPEFAINKSRSGAILWSGLVLMKLITARTSKGLIEPSRSTSLVNRYGTGEFGGRSFRRLIMARTSNGDTELSRSASNEVSQFSFADVEEAISITVAPYAKTEPFRSACTRIERLPGVENNSLSNCTDAPPTIVRSKIPSPSMSTL